MLIHMAFLLLLSAMGNILLCCEASSPPTIHDFFDAFGASMEAKEIGLPFSVKVNKAILNRIEPTADSFLSQRHREKRLGSTLTVDSGDYFGEVGLFNTSDCNHDEAAFLSLRLSYCYQTLDGSSDQNSFLIYESQLLGYVFVSIEIYEGSPICEGDYFTDVVPFEAYGRCTDFTAYGDGFYATYNTLTKPPPPFPNYPSFITVNTYDSVSSCVNETDDDTTMVAQAFATPFQAYCWYGYAINCTTKDDLEVLTYENDDCSGTKFIIFTRRPLRFFLLNLIFY
jgi:hypothetical protein